MALPPLDAAAADLLRRYLAADQDPRALADDHAPDPLPILAFLTRPDIQPWLDAHRTLAARARQHARRHAALTRSLAPLSLCPFPITKHPAASANRVPCVPLKCHPASKPLTLRACRTDSSPRPIPAP